MLLFSYSMDASLLRFSYRMWEHKARELEDLDHSVDLSLSKPELLQKIRSGEEMNEEDISVPAVVSQMLLVLVTNLLYVAKID